MIKAYLLSYKLMFIKFREILFSSKTNLDWFFLRKFILPKNGLAENSFKLIKYILIWIFIAWHQSPVLTKDLRNIFISLNFFEISQLPIFNIFKLHLIEEMLVQYYSFNSDSKINVLKKWKLDESNNGEL